MLLNRPECWGERRITKEQHINALRAILLLSAIVAHLCSAQSWAQSTPAGVKERAEAVVLISETMARYAAGADLLDREIWTSVFTADACYNIIPARKTFPIPEGGFKDRRTIIDFVIGKLEAARKSQPDQRTHHVITNLWIDGFTGNTAVAHAYFMLVNDTASLTTPSIGTTGRYETDMLRGADGTWRIKCIRILGP